MEPDGAVEVCFHQRQLGRAVYHTCCRSVLVGMDELWDPSVPFGPIAVSTLGGQTMPLSLSHDSQSLDRRGYTK